MLVLAAMAGLAGAQPSASPVVSLESQIDESAIIFVGRVVDFQSTGDRGPVATVEVVENVRGTVGGARRQVQIWRPLDGLADLKRRGVRLLILLHPDREWAQAVYEVGDDAAKAPKADFGFLKGGEKILAFARERVREHPETTFDQFVLPLLKGDKGAVWSQELEGTAVAHSMISGLAVPVDGRLEKWAQDNLNSDDIHTASRAVQALGLFKSRENAKRLEGQLESKLYDAVSSGEENGYEVRRYRIRQQAYEILAAWGTAAVKPVMEEKVPLFDSLKELYWQGSAEREKLQVLREFKQLANLQISNTKLGFGEVSLISQVKTLVKLGLTNAGLSDDDLAPLVSLPNLATLEIGGLNVTDHGLRTLAKIKSLRELWVAGTEITEEGLAWLAKERPDIRVSGADQLNPVLRFAYGNDVEGLKRVAARNPADLRKRDFNEETALHVAARAGAFEAVRYLLDEALDVNAVAKDGGTPLYSATSVAAMDYRILELLIARGADVDRPAANGFSPLHLRAIHGSPREVELLLKMGGDPGRIDPEQRARLRAGRPEIARLLDDYEARKRALPAMIPLVKGEARHEVYRLMPGSVDYWGREVLGPVAGELGWTKTEGGRAFLGPFGQEKATLSLAGLPEHGLVTVEVELFLLDSWDGNGDGAGPDILSIAVQGMGSLLHSSFSNTPTSGLPYQSYPSVYLAGNHAAFSGAEEHGTLGLERSAVYRLRFTFAHSGSELRLDFSGLTVAEPGVTELSSEERWGLGGLVVRTD